MARSRMTIRKEENVETRARARIEEIEAMLTTPAYGAVSAKAPLAPLSIERRNPGRRDVQASSPLLKCRDGAMHFTQIGKQVHS